jgi:opacity protein-like surface antigen
MKLHHLFIGAILALSALIANLCVVPYSRADEIFYISPKVMVGKQKAEYGPSEYELKNVGNDTEMFMAGRYSDSGLKLKQSQTFGALAFGIDLFNRFRVPLRIELEISTRADNKTKGTQVRYNSIYPYPPQNPNPNMGYVIISPDSLSYSMHTAYLNLFIDWHNETSFIPYVGGGIGLNFIKGKAMVMVDGHSVGFYQGHTDGETWTVPVPREHTFYNRISSLSWHLDVGVAYKIAQKILIDLSGRYTDYGKSLKLDNSPIISERRDTNGYSFDAIVVGPSEISFKPVYQAVLAVRYMF